MMKKYLVASLWAPVLAGALTLLTGACSKDDDNEPAGPPTTHEAFVETNPATFPAGGGLDLSAADTGQVAQLDLAPAFEWDLKILAIRTAGGGRPAIFLFGNTEAATAVTAVDVSALAGIGLGRAGFEAFTRVTRAMQAALLADGVFSFDPAVDIDANGQPSENRLRQEYQKLVIGDKVVRLDEAGQPVFLVRSREGVFYKFQHVRREGGGRALLRWSRFGDDAVE